MMFIDDPDADNLDLIEDVLLVLPPSAHAGDLVAFLDTTETFMGFIVITSNPTSYQIVELTYPKELTYVGYLQSDPFDTLTCDAILQNRINRLPSVSATQFIELVSSLHFDYIQPFKDLP